MPERAALYVDGFNLYHAIVDLGQNHLKWLDLWALGNLLIPKQSQELVKVTWCTAINKTDVPKMLRHRQYKAALEGAGVTCLEGHFAREDGDCRKCGHTWQTKVEKQSDVNLAISVLDDAYCDVFDHAYLLTADSDQAAVVKLVAQRFPAKKITTVSPPGRSHCKEILEITTLKIALNQSHVERCLFPKKVLKDGKLVAQRNVLYDPPKGWEAPE